MLMDLVAQFTVEFIRALLIDELAQRARARATATRRNRRIQFHLRLRAGRPRDLARNFSTRNAEKVE
jgi:hypothetical protein